MQKTVATSGFTCRCGERVYSGETSYVSRIEETSTKTKKVKTVNVKYCRFCGWDLIQKGVVLEDSEKRAEREMELFGAYVAGGNRMQYFTDND
jgi:NMD protein affecting ribosome stability and mRNA decay